MNVLVTGVAGFIGANFLYYILEAHPEWFIFGLDKLTYAGNMDNFSGLTDEQRKRFEFIKADICDVMLLSDLFAKYEISAIFNFAAESHVDRSIHDPGIFVKTNILGTHNLLEMCKKQWLKDGIWKENRKFMQISTDEVYGSLGLEGLFTEDTPLDPHSPYAASKASADMIVKSYFDTFQMPVQITRCSNNYGPYQFPEKLIPLMVHNALSHKELPVYGDGKHIRDWLYVDDHCCAIDQVFQKGRPGRVYNIGGNNELENINMVTKIIEILSRVTNDVEINRNLIRYIQDRPGHDRRYGLDATRIMTEIGWKPKMRFEEGISITINWYLENRAWVEKIISGEYLAFYEKNYSNR